MTFSPSAIFRSACSRRACSRHCAKVIPVSLENNRCKVRSATWIDRAQSAALDGSEGRLLKASQIVLAVAVCVGMYTDTAVLPTPNKKA